MLQPISINEVPNQILTQKVKTNKGYDGTYKDFLSERDLFLKKGETYENKELLPDGRTAYIFGVKNFEVFYFADKVETFSVDTDSEV